MGQIKLTPEQLRDKSRQYHEQSRVIEEKISNLDGLLNELQEQFKGVASLGFATQFSEIRLISYLNRK